MKSIFKHSIARALVVSALVVWSTLITSFGGSVTVVTHGLQAGGFSWPIPWVDAMADSIASRISTADSGDSISQYVLDASTSGTYSLALSKGPNPGSLGNMADIIVKVNWASRSGLDNPGTADDVGLVLSTALRYPPTDGSFAHAFAELPIHFIGHSRGTYVNSAAISNLGDLGIWVDYNTVLDGQDYPNNSGEDGILTNWTNIRFLDNYYQDLAISVLSNDNLLDGFSMPGAYEIKLSPYNGFYNATPVIIPTPPFAVPPIAVAHGRVHTWYHGTINRFAESVDSDPILRPDWYSTANGQQPPAGFYFDRYVGGVRPPSGLKVAGAARVPTPNPVSSASEWDNIEINSVSPGVSVLPGATLTFQGRYQDANGDATITFAYDTDSNPYNGYSTLGNIAHSAASESTFRVDWNTAGLNSGTYYALAKISSSSGTRYYYYPQAIQIGNAYTLTIQSSGATAVGINASPADNSGASSGSTPFVLSFPPNATVSLSLPSVVGVKVFSSWSGVDGPSGERLARVTMTGNRTVTAVYANATALPGNDLSIYSKGWSDTAGNGDGDGVVEGREDVKLILWLKTSATIQVVHGVLSSGIGELIISHTEKDWPDISANNNERCDGTFNMILNRDSYTNLPFTLRVDYEKNGLPYYQTLSFTKSFVLNGTRKADFDVIGWTLNDSTSISTRNNGDGILQSGEQVRLVPQIRNVGSADATSVRVNICYTNTAQITKLCSEKSYGDILRNQTVSDELFSAQAERGFTGNVCLDVMFHWDQNTNGIVKQCEIPLTIEPEAWLEMPEEQFDFGIVPPGPPIIHTTLIRNTGSKDLQITNVITSAGDTTLVGSPLPWTVAPGQSTNLVIQINTPNVQGALTRVISVQATGRVPNPGRDDQLIISGVVGESVPIYQIPNVTSGSHPDISGDWIVWSDGRNGNADIFAYNLATAQERAVCTNAANQFRPFISGNLVVWEDKRNAPSGPSFDIYACDLSRPELCDFPVLLSSGSAKLIGVDNNLVAVVSDYIRFVERSNWDSARNLIVFEYLGNGQFGTKFNSGFTSNTSHDPMQSIEDGGDFTGGLLVVESHEIYWETAYTNDRWDDRNQRDQIIDFTAVETILRDAGVSWRDLPSAERDRFVYRNRGSDGYDQIYLARANGVNQQLTFGPLDHADDALAIGGDDGNDFVIYDYQSSSRPGLYYLDRSDGMEYIVSTTVDPSEVRMDGSRFVFRERLAGVIKYGFLKQADLQVSAAGITFSNDAPVEGAPIDVSVLVRNLSSYNQSGAITVGLFDGDPDAGGVAITNQTFNGQAAHIDRSVVFSNIPSLSDGVHTIYAKLTVSKSDPALNNKAFKILVVEDTDNEPPTIASMKVEALNGDGDGIIGSDEDARLSLVITDPSGIGIVKVFLDGLETPVSGALSNYSAPFGQLSSGQHNLELRVSDGDTTPSSRTIFSSFVVAPAEKIAVSFGPVSIMNGQAQPIDLGVYELGETLSHPTIFIVENGGQQRLTLANVSVNNGFSAGAPLNLEIYPSALTSFIVQPLTTSLGSYTGIVSIANSDPRSNPFSFPVFATIILPRPSLSRLELGPGGDFAFQFSTAPGNDYFVEASSNLLDWEIVLATNATTNPTEYMAKKISELPRLFYRVSVQEAPPRIPDLTNGLVGWWTFDEGNVGGKVIDHSGNGLDGLIQGSPQIVPGMRGNAMHFNGDYIRVSYDSRLNVSTGLTMAAWVKADAWNGFVHLLGRVDFLNGGQLDVYRLLENNYLYFVSQWGLVGSGTPDWSCYVKTGTPETNKWLHIAATWDGTYMRLFLDGQLLDSTPVRSSILPSTSDFTIAAKWAGSETFHGAMDDCRLYNRALSPDEIVNLAASPK